MLAIALALAASIAWGVADFLGGVKSRELSLLTVLSIAQVSGLALIGAILAAARSPVPDLIFLLYATLAGLAVALGAAFFYGGMVRGQISIVAPISATGVVIPVAVGLAVGERPSVEQNAGLVLAFSGILFASWAGRPGSGRGGLLAAGSGFGILSALALGSFYVAIATASEGGAVWASFTQRVASTSIVLVTALVIRPSFAFRRRDAGVMVGIGLLEVSAIVLFAAATTAGLVTLVSVLASLYPLTTIALAYSLLGERISKTQKVGASMALLGVALIAGG